MGLYRSKDGDWSFPNQYINIMRQYDDLRTVTLRLEAEGADAFSPTASGQTVFRTDGLKVRALTGSSAGWAVTGMPAGGWIQFTNVFVSPGNYKFPVQYSHQPRPTPSNFRSMEWRCRAFRFPPPAT